MSKNNSLTITLFNILYTNTRLGYGFDSTYLFFFKFPI